MKSASTAVLHTYKNIIFPEKLQHWASLVFKTEDLLKKINLRTHLIRFFSHFSSFQNLILLHHLGGQIHEKPWFLVWPSPSILLLSWSTSGLYISPLINPQWKPNYDILTGQAPVLDRSWFIATESQPTLIYFSFGEKGKQRNRKSTVGRRVHDKKKGPPNFYGSNDKQFRQL